MSTSVQDLKSKKFYVALLAEFLGTLLLVMVACGSCISPQGSSIIQISLCFGFSVASIVWAIANVSGGHINPAVTIGFLVTRKISIVRSLLYIAVQCLGAIVGAAILKALTPDGTERSLGTSAPSAGVDAGRVFGVEFFIGFVLVFVVFGTCDSNRKDLSGSGPLAIGVAITMCHLWAVPFTGSGMNPARVLGPAVVSNTWDDHWAYWIGPLAGGAVAAFLYDFIFAVNATPSKLAGFFSKSYDDANFDAFGRRVGAADANGQELKGSA